MRILVVEDQEKLAKLIQKMLKADGFAADIVVDGDMAEQRIKTHRSEYDLILLDHMLPKKNGLEVCSNIRSGGVTTPVLMLTAKSDTSDITSGLDAGADDYLTKPFSFDELSARIRAVLRRPKTSLPTKLTAGNIQLDPMSNLVTVKNAPVKLTLKEYGLLEFLMRHPNEVLSRETILSSVWDFAFDSFANVVDVHIANLRKKLGTIEGKRIETVRGIGYVLKAN